jgi:hypothetical protein
VGRTQSLGMQRHHARVGFAIVSVSFVWLVALALVCAAAALADTATFHDEVPGQGTSVGNSNPVYVTASDDSPIQSGSMTINGFAVSPSAFYLDLSDPNNAILYFDPTADGMLSFGHNFVHVEVTDLAAQTSTFDWDFFVNSPPVISAYSPPASSVTTTSRNPTITVTLTDPDDTSFTGMLSGGHAMTVDGVGVNATWYPSTMTYAYKRSTAWPDPSTRTVNFAVMDSAGNIVTKTWQFAITTTAQITFSGEAPAPASTVATLAVPVGFASQARDARYPFDSTSSGNSIYLDGAPLGTAQTYPTPSDHGTLSLAASQTAMLDGSHSVQARVADIWGLPATDGWSFTVAVPPSASSFSPSPATASARPLISARVADNGPGAPSVVMRVDGTIVSSSFDAMTGVVSYTPAVPLADNADHWVTLAMTDASGNTSNAGWSFHVATASDATFSGKSPAPGSTVSVARPAVSVVATSAVNLVASSAHLKIDGAATSPSVTQPQATRLNVSALDGSLSDGGHTIDADVTDTNGYRSSTSWGFTV